MAMWKVIHLGNRIIRRAGICLVMAAAALGLGEAAAMTATMLISLAVYAYAFGWKFAVGLTGLLLVHELGHLVAARVVGLRSSTPVFVPFLGAVIRLRQPPTSAKMEANVAVGGPAAGTLSALVCLVFFLWTDSTLMLVLAYTACLINLFNLIPCAPLDGGKIVAAISPRMWWLGSLAAGALFFYTRNLFILVIFAFSLIQLWQGGGEERGGRYYRLGLGQRIKVAMWYFGLVGVLGLSTVYLVELLR
jgi:Zn-dependent protease